MKKDGGKEESARLAQSSRRDREALGRLSRQPIERVSKWSDRQANDDWLREEATGEYLPNGHPVNGRPLFRRMTPSEVKEGEMEARASFLNGWLSLEPEGEAEKLEAKILWEGGWAFSANPFTLLYGRCH